jgi:hypothetical protein
MAPDDQGVEITSLREPARTPIHCGVPMRRMQHPSAATGVMRTAWVCARNCGAQIMDPLPREEKR